MRAPAWRPWFLGGVQCASLVKGCRRPTAADIRSELQGVDMLQALRGKKSSLLIKIVLVVITIGFSFWGIESYLFTRVDTSVASVDGTDISVDQFRQRFDENRQRMMQMT